MFSDQRDPAATSAAPRADLWLAGVAWAVIVFSCLQILLFSYGRDQGIYAVVADAVLHGQMPYRDVWDFKPPAIFVTFAFAQALFGKTMTSIRILEVAGLVGCVFAMRRIAVRSFGSAVPGLVGGAIAAITHAQLDFWHTGQPEQFGGMLGIVALGLTVGGAVSEARLATRAWLWAAIGALFGAAFLFKPPLGGGVMPCALYVMLSEWRRSRRLSAVAPAFVMGVSSLAPIAVCALWFALRGAWPALSWTLFEFTPGYTRLGWEGTPFGLFVYGGEEALTRYSYVIPVGLALAALPRLHARERGVVALVLGTVVIHVAGIAMQAKFFPYHFGATLPLMAFVAGLGFYKVWRYVQRVPLVRTLAAVAYAMAFALLLEANTGRKDVPGTFWERSLARLVFLFTPGAGRPELDALLYRAADYDVDIDRQAAAVVTQITTPQDSIFVWGFEPLVYWLSDRRPASRYLYNVPQRATWQRERARTELLEDLHRDPPRLVLIQQDDVFSFVTGNQDDSAAALKKFPELSAFIKTRYDFAGHAVDLEMWLRK